MSSGHNPNEPAFFGPFELRGAERLLLRDGVPVSLGSRAMDVLLCLIERRGDVVSTEDLLTQGWNGLNVEPAALRVQVSALRKALGELDPPARYVTNITGRGYCFVAPVSHAPNTAVPRAVGDQGALPGVVRHMIGRERAVADIEAMLAAERFVTIVGSGGVGKTTVALALTKYISDAFAGDVAFIDLDVRLHNANLAAAIAAALRLTSAKGDAAARGLTLRSRRPLLVLDSCEHVITGASELATEINRIAPEVQILATSREPLNVGGERVYHMKGLETPPLDSSLFEEVCAYPAVQLLADCLAATGFRLWQSPAEAALVADICRKLDGIPLAIQLAAGHIAAFGLEATLTSLNSQPGLC